MKTLQRPFAEEFARRIASAGFSLSLVLAALAPFAAQSRARGRDFAGFYQVSGVTPQGNNYQLTFRARIFNYSGADISGATVSLVDPINPRIAYANFPGISISNRGNTVVSASITIPGSEYQRWRQGSQPQLLVGFVDSQGQHHIELVELARRPVE